MSEQLCDELEELEFADSCRSAADEPASNNPLLITTAAAATNQELRLFVAECESVQQDVVDDEVEETLSTSSPHRHPPLYSSSCNLLQVPETQHVLSFSTCTNAGSTNRRVIKSAMNTPNGGLSISVDTIDQSQQLRFNSDARGSLVSLLSGLYCLILVILSLAFEIANVFVKRDKPNDYQPFYIYLYSVGLLFLAYCYCFLFHVPGSGYRIAKCHWLRVFFSRLCQPILSYCSHRSSQPRSTSGSLTDGDSFNFEHQQAKARRMSAKRPVTHSSPGAGSMYLRLGALIFGIVGMVNQSLEALEWIDRGSSNPCWQPSALAVCCLGILFLFAQLYFVFMNSKLTIHRFKHFCRLGLMHLQATNLCMWIKTIVKEERSVIIKIHSNIAELARKENRTAESKMIMMGLPLLPVMRSSESMQCEFNNATLARFLQTTQPFMYTCMIEYSIICAAIMFILWLNIGYQPTQRIHRRKQNYRVDCGNASKGLFCGLLLLMLVVILTIAFFVQLEDIPAGSEPTMWPFYVAEICIYITMIIVCIIAAWHMRVLRYRITLERVVLLDNILLLLGLAGQLLYSLFAVVAMNKFDGPALLNLLVAVFRMTEALTQTSLILLGQRLSASGHEAQERKPGRQLITFLLVVNLSLWLSMTFEVQKSSRNPLMLDFYGEGPWSLIVHSTVPLTIFFRFHSSVCLAEIWKYAYKTKDPTLFNHI